MRLKNLNPLERQTAMLLLFAALFNGVVQSLNQTQDIIARKALHAADWQLMLMTMIWPVANFFSIWWGRLFERSSHKSRYFLITGIIGRLTLVYAVWLTTMSEYLVLLALLFASNSLPVSYTHLRAHETPEHLVCRLLLEKKKYTTHIYLSHPKTLTLI